jgi:hypothetical protein
MDKQVWTYEGYWAVVLGANRTPAEVVSALRLAAGDDVEHRLRLAEVAAWREGRDGDELPPDWAAHHTTALAALREAVHTLAFGLEASRTA